MAIVTNSGNVVFSSGTRAVTVTKSDTTDLGATKGIYVGSTGDLAVMMVGDTSAVTFAAVPTGTFLPISVRHVMSTNTSASSIIAIY